MQYPEGRRIRFSVRPVSLRAIDPAENYIHYRSERASRLVPFCPISTCNPISSDREMNWKQKSLVQNLTASLPRKLGGMVYYQMQRRFGKLGVTDPRSRLEAGLQMLRYAERDDKTVEGSTIVEVGTGHRMNVPIALWLNGAERICTYDLNPYLGATLVLEDVEYMRAHEKKIFDVFGDVAERPVFQRRWRQLMEMTLDANNFASAFNVEYHGPGDAATTGLVSGSVDLHVSFTVLEHIPPAALANIMVEARRVLKEDGLFIHHIDFTDHFAHADDDITSINFLHFDEPTWLRLGGNRFMYMNRLRVDDMIRLVSAAGLEILCDDRVVDQRALAALQNGFEVDGEFRLKSDETNATASQWIVARTPIPDAVVT